MNSDREYNSVSYSVKRLDSLRKDRNSQKINTTLK